MPPKQQRIVFTGKQQVSVEEFTPANPQAKEVRIRSLCSLMSTGTENIVFNRLFDPGTHWDEWVKYPFRPGYALIGEVEELGPDVRGLSIGDRVAVRHSHASACTLPAANCFPVPADIPPEQAAWFALAKIAAMGARVAKHTLGQSVAVIGCGPVGQMALRWAVAAGADPVIAVDTITGRLEMARRGGATHTIARPMDEAVGEIRDITGGGAEVVVECTGHAAVFSGALGAAAKFGTVVLLGDTGRPSEQRLTKDVVTRGVRIVGAHDVHEGAEWNSARIVRLLFGLVRRGRFSLEGLNTHTFSGAQAADAYRTANEKRGETMGIVFKWD